MRLFRFRLPWRRPRAIGADVDAELRFHLDARTDALVAAGLSRDAARAQAEREFGDLPDARRYMIETDTDFERRRRRSDFVDDLLQDIRFAFRTLRNARGFAAAALVTLALGMGATTAVVSIVDGVLLRPLPYPDADRLVRLSLRNPKSGDLRPFVSPVDVDDWRERRKAFTDLGGTTYFNGLTGADLTGSGDPERVSIAFFTPGLFATLGVPPALGRAPRDDEAVRGGPDHVVVLSWRLWQRRFGGARTVVDSTILLGGEPYHVLGVMPRDFAYPAPTAEAWVPLSTVPDNAIPRIRDVATTLVVGRIRPEASPDAAAADVDRITAQLAAEYPQSTALWSAGAVQPLRETIVGAVRPTLLLLLAAVAFLLLMACVNVAGLLLARASAREREIAVRVALGAGRGRLVRQLVTESVVLSVAGGAVGLLVAQGLVAAVAGAKAASIPRIAEVHVDWPVLAFTAALSVVTGALFGLVPALKAVDSTMHESLRGGRGAVGGRSRLRSSLVVAQVALATVLVVGAALMGKSFAKLLATDPGFDPAQRVAVTFTISTDRHKNYRQFYREVVDRVRQLPGVIAAAAVRDAPFHGDGENWGMTPPGVVVAPGERRPNTDVNFVSDGYFRTLGTPIVAGREFDATDHPDSTYNPVIVNAAFAKRWLPPGRAVGERITLGILPAEVIGVVGDIRQVDLDKAPSPTAYLYNMQHARVKTTIIAKVAGEPYAAARAIRDAIWSLDHDQPIADIYTLETALHDAAARPRLLTLMLGAFGALGLILGAVGIYGVLAYLVSQRAREIGVRLALGAEPGAVSRMVVGRGLGLAALGVAIGVVAALAAGRGLRGLLYGVEPTDPAMMALAAALLTLVAVAASWVPARRAAGVDPVTALRAGE